MQENIAVLGCGWGMALAILCRNIGHKVTLWSPFPAEIQRLRETGENPYLPGVPMPEDLHLTADIQDLSRANFIIMSAPSYVVRETSRKLRGIVKNGVIITVVSKGMEEASMLRLSQVVKSELPAARVVVLSGPSHAEEVARGIPTSIVAASEDREAAKVTQDLMMCDTLRIYTNPDMIGVELGGALKNVIALSAGISDGLGLGDNTKAALLTRGLTEIARLGVAMGARQETFAGLTGIGDLVVTCCSMHSRNRRFGILVGQGVPVREALEKIGMTVEGYYAARIAHVLSLRYKTDMPISRQCYRILYEGETPKTAIRKLMRRPKKEELETTWL